jgi:GT2 family glycosyltransferase
MCVEYALEHAGEQDFVFTLNNDTELENDTLQKLVEFAGDRPNSIIGAVNVFYSEPFKIEPSAFKKAGSGFFKKMPHRVNEWAEDLALQPDFMKVDALSGKGVLIPVIVFKKIGLYNFKKLPHYHADTEFTLRAARAGINVFILYTAKVLSHQNLSGTGTQTSVPNISEFIKSFKSLKSANHYTTLKNLCFEVYGLMAPIYLIVYLTKPILGFAKRLLLSKIK